MIKGENMDIISKIKRQYNDFSKGQKQIGDYILNHYDIAAYLTAASLGKMVGVSESTVVRFAFELGYDGYPNLQRSLQDGIKTKLTSVQRMAIGETRIGTDDILTAVLNQDIEKIKKTIETIDKDAFKRTVQTITNSKRIYVLGVRSSSALANFLSFYLNLIFSNVRLVQTTSASEMFEQIIRVSQDDVVIGISFPRYSLRTIRALRYARDKGAQVVAITDSLASPIVEHANHVLTARSDMTSFVDSLVAPLSVINSLIVALGMEKKTDLMNTFDELEKIWEEYDVYEKVTDDNE